LTGSTGCGSRMADMRQILGAMSRVSGAPEGATAVDMEAARADLQRRLSAGEITLPAFGREWRRLERPQASRTLAAPVEETRLARARELLERFGDLWVDADVPGKLRQEAAHELFGRIDVLGPEVVALHPRPNENAWLLGYAAMRDGSLMTQEHVGMVGARGVEPTLYG
jgi:hypothetical protein